MTLRLQKNELNLIVLTLKELQTLDSPYWLFVFRNEENLINYQSILLTDLSTSTERFNEFELTLPTDLDLKQGDYIYKVYEQTSNSNLDPDLADNLCETGKALVIGTGATEYFNNVT